MRRKAPPQASRRRYARWWFEGRSASAWPSSAARSSPHRAGRRRRFTSLCWSRPSAAPAVTAPVGRFRRSSSCRTRPQTLPLHCARSSLHCVAGRARSLRRGCGVWRHSCAFGDCFKGCHTHAFASLVLLGGCRRFGSAICNRRSRQESCCRRQGQGSFGLRAWHHAAGCSAPSSLHSAPPRTSLRSPPRIVPRLRPSQEELRAPASGVVCPFVPHSHTTPPAPDPRRSLWECASGTSFVSAELVGSRCRLRALVASSVVLVTPGASALLRRLCSLVVPAGTLDAAPSGGGRQLSFRLSPKQVVQLVGRGR